MKQKAMLPDFDTCWQAVKDNNAAYDDVFLYGVVTMGVYCKPSCPSRDPLRKNVRFFENSTAARDAGLRACKRCRPT